MKGAESGQGRYRPAPTVRRMRLGYRSVFFCERAQRLFELNPTADVIWGALLEESTPRAARRALMQLGAAPEQAEAYVDSQLRQWLKDGYWTPAELRPAAPPSHAVLRLAIDRLRVEILCAEGAALQRLGEVFAAFPPFTGAPTAALRITSWSGGFHLFEGESYLGAAQAEELAPRVKAALTDLLVRQKGDGFFAHGALLAREGRTLMLSGPPGAGKSTLAMALGAAGWTLLADDVIRVDSGGLFRPVPFAPALKEGAWPLLASRVADLESWPVELRADGQKVRYAPMPQAAVRPRPLDLFVVLEREDGVAARTAMLDPLEALSVLLKDAYAAGGRLSAGLMARLVERFREVDCRRLGYGGLDPAIAAIERLRHEP